MDNLIIVSGKEPRVSTTVIALGVNNSHNTVKTLLKTHQRRLETLGTLPFEMVKSKGRPMEVWYLNEQQVTFLITLMKNSESVIDFKLKLTKEFYKMKAVIADIAVRQQNTEWLEQRESGKHLRKKQTDIIKDFTEYATEQGSKNAVRYYSNITTMENKALFILEQKFDNIREILTGQQLAMISAADHITETAIKEGMEMGLPYKEIFQLAKSRVETFAGMIPKTQVPMVTQSIIDKSNDLAITETS
jgi:phage regulator Rha-like protein